MRAFEALSTIEGRFLVSLQVAEAISFAYELSDLIPTFEFLISMVTCMRSEGGSAVCGRLLRELTRLVRRRMLMSAKRGRPRLFRSSCLSIRGEPIGPDYYTGIAVDPSVEPLQLLLNNNGCFAQHDDACLARSRIRILKNIRSLQNRCLGAMASILPAHKEHSNLRVNTSIQLRSAYKYSRAARLPGRERAQGLQHAQRGLEPRKIRGTGTQKLARRGEAIVANMRTQVQDVSGGCGSMYALDIVSEQFKGLPIVKQHRLVNKVLGEEIKKWHGVQMKTKSP
jgi:stress-induced morphogen